MNGYSVVTVSLGLGYLLVFVPRVVGYTKIMQILSQGHPVLEIKAGSLKGAARKLPLDELYKESHRLITIGSYDKSQIWENILERAIIRSQATIICPWSERGPFLQNDKTKVFLILIGFQGWVGKSRIICTSLVWLCARVWKALIKVKIERV